MMKKNKIILIMISLLLMPLFIKSRNGYTQNGITLSGKIYVSTTKQAVDFSTVIIEETKEKAHTTADGSFSINIPQAGTYTIIVQSSGLKAYKTSLDIQNSIVRDFFLDPMDVRGSGITIIGERDIQKVSRRTMNNEEVKATPLSAGDPLVAMTSMPGINKTELTGFYGPIVIRSMYPNANRYFIDGIPVFNPQHFGAGGVNAGLHSIFNVNFVDNIDLYASAYPSKFGGALGAILDFHSIENVKKQESIMELNILSLSAMTKIPLNRKVILGEKVNEENAGYLVASGRYSTNEALAESVKLYGNISGSNKKLTEVMEYYDYQLKGKYYLNNRNSLGFLFFGGRDNLDKNEQAKLDEGEDPLFNGLKVKNSRVYNSLGFYHNLDLNRMKNRLMAYSSLKTTHNSSDTDVPEAASWVKDYSQTIGQYISGIKDDMKIEWIKNHAELGLNLEYTNYMFKAKGKQLSDGTAGILDEVFTDFGDDNALWVIPLDSRTTNHLISGNIDNRFKLEGLTFTPGFRVEHLKSINETTYDPRGMISYEFPTRTTISTAGGRYSSFIQINPYEYEANPDIVEYDNFNPERAYHRVAGVEQRLGLLNLELETYYNNAYDLVVNYPHYENGKYVKGLNSGKFKVYGFEVILKKDKERNRNDFFGWVSYTYNQAKYKSGITGNAINQDGTDTGDLFDPAGNKWITADYETRHSAKAVLGYVYNNHTFTTRFQLFSSLPNTPIIGSDADPGYPGRYVPVYDESNPNSTHYPIRHRLDLRYSYTGHYSWGSVTWYIELMNVYLNKVHEEKWKYDSPYQAGYNPPDTKAPDDEGSWIIPNFGVEIKF